MQTISNLTVFTGTIPNKATQTDNEFANNIFGFLNYSGVPFVRDLNIIVDELNTLIDEIGIASSETAQHATDAQIAYENTKTAIALLDAGSIDDITIASNKTYSNEKINSLFSLREDKLGTNIASTATTTIGTIGLGDTIHITGTTTITSFGVAEIAGIKRTIIFDGALTLTNGINLICPGATNITTIPGTVIEVIAETTTTWRVLFINHPNISFTELAYLNNLESNILTLINNATPPVGTIITFASTTAPTGYLKCNGALISRTTYASLFEVIGTTFGIGDDSTTFALPDLRGYFPRGFDDARGIDPGRIFGSNQDDEFESHSHTVSNMSLSGTSSSGSTTWKYGGSTATAQVGGTETRPKNIALLYCIKY